MTETVFWEGDELYSSAFSAMQNAKISIFLEMYIFRDDEAGKAWSDHLIKAAKRGVKVRVIYDRIGSFSSSANFWENMKTNGVEVIRYRGILKNKRRRFLEKINLKYPVWLIWFLLVFFRRDHRKIIIIDEKIAYTGGFNIMNAASKMYSDKTRWLDAFYMTTDPIIVKELLNIHLDTMRRLRYQIRDILSLNRKKANEAILYPYKKKNRIRIKALNFENNNIGRLRYAKAVKNLIKISRKKIYIITPYFVPGKSFLRRLIKKAKKGADVRLYLSYRSDLILIQYVSLYLARKLIKYGVQVFLFHGKETRKDKDRFNHSKVFIFDDWVGVGSGNVDSRSFFHNLDIHVFRKNPPFIKDVEKKIQWIEKHSIWAEKKDLPIRLIVFLLLPFRRFL